MSGGTVVDYDAKDFLDGTWLLDPFVELAYRRVCDLIYVTGDQVDDDDSALRKFTKAGNRWKRIKAELIAAGKLFIDGGRITNRRCRTELSKKVGAKVAPKVVDNVGLFPPPDCPPSPSPAPLTTTPPLTPPPCSDPSGSVAGATPPAPRGSIFDLGEEVLGTGSRSLIGKARRQHGDLVTMEALLACRAEAPSEPVEFFIGCLKQRGTNGRDKRSPAAKLFAGYAAAAGFDSGADSTFVVPLLDSR